MASKMGCKSCGRGSQWRRSTSEMGRLLLVEFGQPDLAARRRDQGPSFRQVLSRFMRSRSSDFRHQPQYMHPTVPRKLATILNESVVAGIFVLRVRLKAIGRAFWYAVIVDLFFCGSAWWNSSLPSGGRSRLALTLAETRGDLQRALRHINRRARWLSCLAARPRR